MVTFHKVVGSLPATLEPDAIYFVRVGVGIETWVVNSDGTAAYSMGGGGVIIEPVDPVDPVDTIGGYAIGQVGPTGSIYEGLRLIEGDDFNAIPSRWSGRDFQGRYSHSALHIGFRGTNVSHDRALYIDPAFRGARSQSPVDLGYDGVTIANGFARLTATPSPAELQPFLPSTYGNGRGDAQNRPLLISGGLKTGPSFMLSAGADFAIECRVRLQAGQKRGYWPSFWTSSFFWPDMAEIDILEGKKRSDGNDPMTTLMNYIANATDGSGVIWSTEAEPTIPTERWVILGARRTGNTLTFYDDIANEGTIANRVTVSETSRIERMRGAHDIRLDLAVSNEWDQSTFDISDWPATLDFDYWRAWIPVSAARGNEPTMMLPAVETQPGGSWAATLPSAVELHGSAPGLEQVSGAFDNHDAPGMPTRNSATKLPTSMTVSLANRTVAGTVPLTEGGAMGVFITYAYNDGSPAHRVILPYYVAPAIQNLPQSWAFDEGSEIDIEIPFAAFHSGNLGPHVYEIIAPGLTVTGEGTQVARITGTLTQTTQITITAINTRGQRTSVERTLTARAVTPPVDPGNQPAYATWTGPGWFDMSDQSTLTVANDRVSAIANKRSGGGNLIVAGNPANVILSPVLQNERPSVRIVRIPNSDLNMPRLEASASAQISQVFAGDDSPHTLIIAYMPTDTNTGYIFSATGGSDELNDTTVALIRRITNASVRRKSSPGVNNDVDFGTGQPANVPRIVAIRHTGQAITIFDNNLTPIVSEAAQNSAAFNFPLQFTLGAARANTTAFAGTQASVNYFEVIVESAQRTNAEIQQVMRDLSAKWGIAVAGI